MNVSTPNPVVEKVTDFRTDIEVVKEEVMDFIKSLKDSDTPQGEDKGEQIANAMLAYRHLEDAKMRMGKVIQATVGFSVYDKGPEDSGKDESQPDPNMPEDAVV